MTEKGCIGKGVINTGIYRVDKTLMSEFPLKVFSFESDFLANYKQEFKLFLTNSYFIDIGIPEDYYRACEDLR